MCHKQGSHFIELGVYNFRYTCSCNAMSVLLTTFSSVENFIWFPFFRILLAQSKCPLVAMNRYIDRLSNGK